MKSTLFATAIALGATTLGLWSQEPKFTNAEAAKILKDSKDRVGYAYGLNLANSMKRQGAELNPEMLRRAMEDVLAGRTPLLTEGEARVVMTEYQRELRSKAEVKRKELGEKNKVEGQKFLAENKTKPGVKLHKVKLADGREVELQYKVLKEGNGAIPKSDDTVSTHYRGTLINGTEFDSSHKRGQPAEFGVAGVIKGWTEALQMMKVGSKWQLFIPAELAYGDRGAGADIGPNAVLLFDIELLEIKTKPKAEPAAAAANPQSAVTSDIIKVPSAEELKKGAKIEVIKATDVERLQKEAKEAGKPQPK